MDAGRRGMDLTRSGLALLAVGLLLAGCAAPASTPSTTSTPAAVNGDLGPLPTREKTTFGSTQPPLLPVMQAMPAATFTAPDGTARLLLAFDLSSPSPAPLTLRIEGPSGVVGEAQVTAPGKKVFEAAAPAGAYRIVAQSDATWTLGLVRTAFPTGFVEGTRLQVSTPESQGIEHFFVPKAITAAADTATRITLYDFDPHAGIDNLQHNLDFPGLNLKTEGQTTWGEVRVLDLPALAPGDYAFRCSFHGFTGTLAVA